MTQVALVTTAIPGFGAGVILDIVVVPTGEQAGRVGDYVVFVVLAHISVNSGAVDARFAGTAFKVEEERGPGNKLHVTASEWANYIFCTMDGRVEVL